MLLQTNLDTVIVDADARTVTLIWRAFTPLRSGPHDVSGIVVGGATTSQGPSLEPEETSESSESSESSELPHS
jgi:hypothetical protein